MARNDGTQGRCADRIVLYIGTMSQTTVTLDRVSQKHKMYKQITLAKYLTMHMTGVDRRNIQTIAENCEVTIALSNTIVLPDTGMSLFSVPAKKPRKTSGVTFKPGLAGITVITDGFPVLGYATAEDDGLFYLNDEGSNYIPTCARTTVKVVMYMMAGTISNSKRRQTSDIIRTDKSTKWNEALENATTHLHDFNV